MMLYHSSALLMLLLTAVAGVLQAALACLTHVRKSQRMWPIVWPIKRKKKLPPVLRFVLSAMHSHKARSYRYIYCS